jgi:type II secretory ATPase GspE/PulE/Tfp pilus assembly ATPase PilB-like protein
LIGASLIGVLSQRLIRRICGACRRPDTPAPEVVSMFFDTVPAGFVFYRGAGCSECGQTGYKGRLMLANLWVPDAQDLRLIGSGAPFEEVRKSAERTTISMAQDAHGRLSTGETTMEELLRVMSHTAIAEHRATAWGPPADR